jgi:hypothetical protein
MPKLNGAAAHDVDYLRFAAAARDEKAPVYVANVGGFWRRVDGPPAAPLDYAEFRPNERPDYVKQQHMAPGRAAPTAAPGAPPEGAAGAPETAGAPARVPDAETLAAEQKLAELGGAVHPDDIAAIADATQAEFEAEQRAAAMREAGDCLRGSA